MKTCPKCNKELKDAAKFCGGCGYKFPDGAAAPSGGASCTKCGNPLKPGAKFCGKCGSKQGDPVSRGEGANPEAIGSSGFIRWTMLPGQVAVSISEAEIEACGKIKGISIQDGTKALIFVNGKLVAELAAGNYKFSDIKNETVGQNEAEETRAGGFWGFLRRSGEAAGRAVSRIGQAIAQAVTGEKVAVSIVLVRSTEFPLVFEVKGANTQGIRSDVGLHVICKIGNINAFYRALLTNKKFVAYTELQQALASIVANGVNAAVSGSQPNQVANNPALVQALTDKLQAAIVTVYPFLSVNKVLQLTADNQALTRLRGLGEELYVSEQELAHLQKRNDFLNRLQATKNAQEIAQIKAANGHEINKGQLEADLQAKKLEIYKQMELTADEEAKFDLMLSAERKLREAKTQDQIDAAMHEYEKSGMLREQELDQLRHKGVMADLRNTQEYDMAELRGELALKREQDAYDDERRDKAAAFQDSRRRAEMQLDREEQQNQLDMLRQAQAIRMEREDALHRREMETQDAAHRRELESENAARAHEQAMQQAQLDAKVENQRIYAGMSFEQIMAANPDISPEAAKALAQKFNSDNKEELLRAREADMARQNAQQMEMMRMMQQMAMAGMGVNQQHQQEMTAAKQAELDRVRADATRNEDRLLTGLQTTVTAAGNAFAGRPINPATPTAAGARPAPAAKAKPAAAPVCPSCGAELEPDSSFCGECGTSL